MRRSDNTADFFERTAAEFAANYRSSPEFLERREVWRCAIEKNLPRSGHPLLCLDLGCGDGSLSRFLAKRGFKTVGIDQSEAMLSIARHKAVEHEIEGYTEYIRASLPLSGDLERRYLNSAHVILCSSVLEYLANPEDVLGQFDRILAPGGVLLISFPNRFSFYRVCEQTLSGILKYTDSYVRHQRYPLTLPHVKQVLNRIGFTMIDETFFALPFQRYTEWLFGSHRGNRVATMVLLVAKKLE
jgi:2-polyprenyl-6-hydroxyphenyl methylase/3-demethylubiquinone-9 3-methyltransferase